MTNIKLANTGFSRTHIRSLALLCSLFVSSTSWAFPSFVLEATLEVCNVAPTLNSPAQSTEVFIGTQFDNSVPPGCNALTTGFDVQIGAASYNTLHINRDGILTFGGPLSVDPPGTDLFGLTQPAIAPFYRDMSDHELEGMRWGWGFGAYWMEYNFSNSVTGDRVDTQIALLDQGGGDFDLYLNYNSVDTAGAQVGWTDGAGGGYMLPGAGSYTGSPSDVGGCSAPSLNCYNTNVSAFGEPPVGRFLGASEDAFSNVLGRHRFEFRNGVVTVPEPSLIWLLGLGLALTLVRRSRQATN